MCDQVLHWRGNVLAPHERDGTKRTRTIAPFCNLEVSIVCWSREQPLPDQLLFVVRPQGFEQAWQVPRTEPSIHLRNAFLQFVFVAFRQATSHVDTVYIPGLFRLRKLDDCIDAFLLGALDESARVDDDYTCII